MACQKPAGRLLLRCEPLFRSSSCHGLPDWFHSPTPAHRLFWSIILIGSFTAIIYYSILITLQFIDNPTATKITEIPVTELPFPNVTICSHDKFSRRNFMRLWDQIKAPLTQMSSVVGFQMSDPLNLAGYISTIQGDPGGIDSLVSGMDLSYGSVASMETQYQLLFNSSIPQGLKLDVQEFLLKMAHQCDEIFLQCIFSSQAYNCCDFVTPIFTTTGVCYHMVPKKRQVTQRYAQQSIAGSPGGLLMKFRSDKSDVPIMPKSAAFDEGFMAFIADYYSLFVPDIVSVAPGTHGRVTLNPVYRILHKQKQKCAEESSHAYMTKPGVDSYRVCQLSCFLNLTYQLCGCYPLGAYAEISSDVLCSPVVLIQCLGEEIVHNPQSDSRSLSCTNYNCTQMCRYWTYGPTVMYSRVWPTNTNSTEDITKLDIYYGQLLYTQVSLFPC